MVDSLGLSRQIGYVVAIDAWTRDRTVLKGTLVEEPDLMFKTITRGSSQRGITGLETAIILIAFVVVASVFIFTVLSTGIFTSERSKETIFVGTEETKSTLEPSGSLVAYKADRGGTDTIYKLLFIVSNVVSGSPIDLPPLHG
jgi:flagellin-like protein